MQKEEPKRLKLDEICRSYKSGVTIHSTLVVIIVNQRKSYFCWMFKIAEKLIIVSLSTKNVSPRMILIISVQYRIVHKVSILLCFPITRCEDQTRKSQ